MFFELGCAQGQGWPYVASGADGGNTGGF